VLGFVLQRLLNLIPVFLGATLLTFLIIQAAPGDFLDARRLDPRTTPEMVARLERQFGLDKSLFEQYMLWLGNFVRGNMGVSFDSNVAVWDLIAPKIGNSALLVFGELILLYLIAVPLGIYSAVRQYSLFDKLFSLVSYFLIGFPSFFLALLFIFGLVSFRLTTGSFLLPVGGMTSEQHASLGGLGQVLDVLWHLIAPMLALLVGDIAALSRSFRAQMLEFLNQDFVRTARAKGLAERSVIYKHTLRNALTPFIAGIGALLPALLSGAGFIEVVFNWPGLTPVFLEAINSQDVYVLLSIGAVSLVLLVVGNLLSDLLLALTDPRVRYG
jgi:peptide/nickel transport system permease protein